MVCPETAKPLVVNTFEKHLTKNEPNFIVDELCRIVGKNKENKSKFKSHDVESIEVKL